MRFRTRGIRNFFAIITFFCGLLLSAQLSSAEILAPGDTGVFRFDISGVTLSNYFSAGYYVNAADPVYRFGGSLSYYDELASPAKFTDTSPFYGKNFALLFFDSDSLWTQLFGDPISYLTIQLDAVFDIGNNTLDQADFSPYLTLFANQGGVNYTVEGVPYTHQVPEPATLLLLGLGLIGLSAYRKKMK